MRRVERGGEERLISNCNNDKEREREEESNWVLSSVRPALL